MAHYEDSSVKTLEYDDLLRRIAAEEKEYHLGSLWMAEKVEKLDKLRKDGFTFLLVSYERYQKIFVFMANQREILLDYYD